MKYIKQFDSLRAIAVFLVIASHWLTQNPLVRALQPGQLGVNNIFFVLSGFLITGLLLNSRIKAETADDKKGVIIKRFFVGRALRIFPAYYLLIFLLYNFADYKDTTLRANLAYYVTYTTNFYFYHINSWDGMTSHLWSLAVEEQFYLLWPWLIVLAPRRALLPCIVLFIAIGTTSGYIIGYKDFGFALPCSCFDSFGLGALLAFVVCYHADYLPKFYAIVRGAALAFAGLLVVSVALKLPTLTLSKIAPSVIILWLITYIVYANSLGKTQFLLLNNSVLIFIGRISYGMYLYHLPLAWDYGFLHQHLNKYLPKIALLHETYVVFVENFIVLIGICWLSAILIERPIVGLRKFLEPKGKAPVFVALKQVA